MPNNDARRSLAIRPEAAADGADAAISSRDRGAPTASAANVPVFVIALERSPRAPALCARLLSLAVPFERVDAIDGNGLDRVMLDEVYDEAGAISRVGRSLGREEIGCALSHRLVYRRMIERGVPIAIVLEEDAIIGTGFKRLWQAACALPAAVDVLLLYSEIGFVRDRRSATLGGFALHRATTTLSSTVGYVLRLECARSLLHATKRISSVADWPLGYREISQFLALPMVVSHSFDGSTIDTARRASARSGGRPAWRWFRSAMHLTYLPYIMRPELYRGRRDYYDREVAARLKRLHSPSEIDVKTFRLSPPEMTPA